MILETRLVETHVFQTVFQFRVLSKKFSHDVRNSLIQFSASELHEVSSYGHLKIQGLKWKEEAENWIKLLLDPMLKNDFEKHAFQPNVSPKSYFWYKNKIQTW